MTFKKNAFTKEILMKTNFYLYIIVIFLIISHLGFLPQEKNRLESKTNETIHLFRDSTATYRCRKSIKEDIYQNHDPIKIFGN